MSWSEALERTVTGLHYDLVDVERSAGGLLRVTIDRLPGQHYPTGEGAFVLVEDCEIVTRQLQYVLEVEAVDYARLEVSSPGLDRPLKKPADWRRFVGEEVEVTLREAFQNRKKWRGVLVAGEQGPDGPDAQAWRLVLPLDKPLSRTAAKKLAKAAAAGLAEPGAGAQQTLDFNLDEVREARLVPVVDFKGRPGDPDDGTEAGEHAGRMADKVDGGQD
ncbi:MAG: ribosome maturation factor RimP [Pseudomonadota bacterium]